jgi:hypothetical protein
MTPARGAVNGPAAQMMSGRLLEFLLVACSLAWRTFSRGTIKRCPADSKPVLGSRAAEDRVMGIVPTRSASPFKASN